MVILTCPEADYWLTNLMACVISSSATALKWNYRSLSEGCSSAGFLFLGGVRKSNVRSRFHFTSKLL